MHMDVKSGDTIEVHSRQVGGAVRRGVVKDVIDTEPLELRVEWEDGHESTLYPHAGMARVADTNEGA